MEKLDGETGNEVCRLCLGQNGLAWIFDDRMDNNIKDIIFATSGVEILENDVVSQKVCVTCLQITIKMFRFRSTAQKNDRELKAKYDHLRKKQEPVEVKKSDGGIVQKPAPNKIVPSKFQEAQKAKIIDKNSNCKTDKPQMPTPEQPILPKLKKVHPSIIKMMREHPNVKFPKIPLNAHFGPYITLMTDEVDSWYKDRSYSVNAIERFKKIALSAMTWNQSVQNKRKTGDDVIVETVNSAIDPNKKIRLSDYVAGTDNPSVQNQCKISDNNKVTETPKDISSVNAAMDLNKKIRLTGNVVIKAAAQSMGNNSANVTELNELRHLLMESDNKTTGTSPDVSRISEVCDKQKSFQLTDNADVNLPSLSNSLLLEELLRFTKCAPSKEPINSTNELPENNNKAASADLFEKDDAISPHGTKKRKKFVIEDSDDELNNSDDKRADNVNALIPNIGVDMQNENSSNSSNKPNQVSNESPGLDDLVGPLGILPTDDCFRCKVCEATYSTMRDLSLHMTLHPKVIEVVEKSENNAPTETSPVNDSSDEPGPLLLPKANKSYKLYTCQICDSVHYSKKDLRLHQNRRHIRCPFCAARFKTPSLQREHITLHCGIDKAQNNLKKVDIILTKIDENEEIRKKYPQAFETPTPPPPPPPLATSPPCEDIPVVNVEELPQTVNPEAEKVQDDVICISDDEGVTTTRMLRPKINIAHTDVIREVNIHDNDRQILRQVLTKFIQEQRILDTGHPTNQSIVEGPNRKTQILKNLRRHLSSYNIPVELQHSDKLSVQYKYGRAPAPPKKKDFWKGLKVKRLLTPTEVAEQNKKSTAVEPPTTINANGVIPKVTEQIPSYIINNSHSLVPTSTPNNNNCNLLIVHNVLPVTQASTVSNEPSLPVIESVTSVSENFVSAPFVTVPMQMQQYRVATQQSTSQPVSIVHTIPRSTATVNVSSIVQPTIVQSTNSSSSAQGSRMIYLSILPKATPTVTTIPDKTATVETMQLETIQNITHGTIVNSGTATTASTSTVSYKATKTYNSIRVKDLSELS